MARFLKSRKRLDENAKPGSPKSKMENLIVKWLVFVLLMLMSVNAAIAADKVETIPFTKAVSHYENSKYYQKDTPIHFAGGAMTLTVTETLEKKSFKLRTSARPHKDKDDSPVQIRMKVQGVCNYVFSSVISKMKQYANEIGANAIVNITSDYEGRASDDPASYECIRGALLSAVTLKGEFVKLENQ